MPPLFERFPELSTERLRLRELVANDADALFAIFSVPEVVQYYDLPQFTQRVQAEQLIEQRAADFASSTSIRWGITLAGDDEVIGTLGLHCVQLDHGFAELGYDLHPDHWRRGIVSEAVTEVLRFAFDDWGLHRVEALSDPRNTASRALLEKLGFREEGVLRERFHKDGAYLDDVMYGRLATD